MTSLKEYAKAHSVSYEAIRKQVVRFSAELEGHIKKVDRTQFLDDYAVEFLNEKRASNPVIILESSKDERIQELESANQRLLIKVTELQEQLLAEKDSVKQLQQEKIQLLEAASGSAPDFTTEKKATTTESAAPTTETTVVVDTPDEEKKSVVTTVVVESDEPVQPKQKSQSFFARLLHRKK